MKERGKQKRGKKRDRERRQIIKLTAAALILVHDAWYRQNWYDFSKKWWASNAKPCTLIHVFKHSLCPVNQIWPNCYPADLAFWWDSAFVENCLGPQLLAWPTLPLEKPIVAKKSGSQGNLVNILSHHFMGLGDNIRVWIKNLYEITIPRGALAHFNRNRKITNQK